MGKWAYLHDRPVGPVAPRDRVRLHLRLDGIRWEEQDPIQGAREPSHAEKRPHRQLRSLAVVPKHHAVRNQQHAAAAAAAGSLTVSLFVLP